MTSTREGVNPLRPYYIPPTIGIAEKNESTPPPQPNPFSHANATTTTASSSSNSNVYATKARGIFQDIDYKDYINDSSPSTVQSVKSLVDELLWKYTSVLMAQPFEVAKTILQVRLQDDLGGLHIAPQFTPAAPNHRSKPSITSPKNPWSHSDNELQSEEEEEEKELMDSEDEEQNYFTSNVPYTTPTPGPRSSHNNRRHPTSPPLTGSPKPSGGKPGPPGSVAGSAAAAAAAAATPAHPYQLGLRRPDSVFDVISQLWSKESAWGVWKGTNATFLYTVLQSLVENWSRSLLSALLNVPDLGVKDDVDRLVDIASPYPWASLCVAAAAAVASGLALAPLDLVRTRLIITSTSPPFRSGGSRRQRQRRTVATLRALPSWTCPAPLVVPTVLNALVHPLVTLSAPLVLRSQFLIDRDLSPTTFSVAKFCTSCAALFVKLPLETVLRRGQVAVLRDPAYVHAIEGGDVDSRGGANNSLHRRSRSSALSPSSLSLSLGGIGDERQAFGGGGRGGHDDEDEEEADLELETIVQPGAYSGVFGTMYSIATEEGSRALVTPQPKQANNKAKAGKRGAVKAAKLSVVPETTYKKGQGVEGLWRGWKVSWWGLVGLWVANVAGGGGEGEF